MNKQYVLITGAARRLGREIATFLAKKGCNIVIHYNNSKIEAEELARDLKRSFNVKAFLVQADLNDSNAIKNIFATLTKQEIEVNTLINSASSFWFDDFFNYNSNSWQENFNTNLKAPYLLSLAFVEQLKASFNNPKSTPKDKQENYNIINIVDSWVNNVSLKFLSYNLAKLALERLTEVMALELAPLVRVNGVAPGLTLKPCSMHEERFGAMFSKTPMQVQVNPNDIASTIWFIINTKSICGEIIKVDCGRSLVENKPLE